MPVAAAIVRVFIEHGDRTDRKKARLKYVLDAWGFEKFLAEVEKELGAAAPQGRRSTAASRRRRDDRWAHVGVPPAEAAGPVLRRRRAAGRPDDGRPDATASPTIADRFGSGTIRLTVWQNLLISDIAEDDVDDGEAGDRGSSASTGTPRASGAAWSPARATPAASSPAPTPRRTR